MSETVRRFWEDSHGRELPADTFLGHPLIQTYVSLRAFGHTRGHLVDAIETIGRRTRPGARILSVGCGAALKEMAIAAALPDREFVGIDIVDDTLARSRAAAAERGIDNLALERGDFNALDLEAGSCDLILGLGAIHHVENLEGFWDQCRRSLRPGGAVVAQEYLGPNRFQWTDEQIEIGNRMLREIVPIELVPDDRAVAPVPLEELVAADPSEAVRSSEIVPTCTAAGFALQSYRGAGCGLLQPVLMNRIEAFDPVDWQHNHVLFTLFAAEDRHMRQRGTPGDNYATFTAV